MPLVETHCHLDMLKERPLEETLELAQSESVEKVITISTKEENFQTVLELTQKSPTIYGTLGTHPHEAKNFSSNAPDQIKELIKDHPKAFVAIGEIGLDYHYNHSEQNVQKDVFEKQLHLARELDLPVVIHSRDADEDMQSILKNFSGHLKKKGVIHSFTSSMALAEFALQEGFYLGFNGIITFKKAQNVRDIVKLCPKDRLLTETDAPFLTPVPHRGKENAPHYLPFVVETLANLKEMTQESLIEETYENAHRLFPFS